MNGEGTQGPVWVRFGRLIRVSHTVFALPFALAAMLVAAGGVPAWPVVAGVLVCLASARTAAMCFNRLADWGIDMENPRTRGRHRLVGRMVVRAGFWVSVGVFVLAAACLNPLCAALAPVAVGLICVYSLTKRFTAWCHAVLGLSLAAAPMGAWAAVRGELATPLPYVLALGVLLWVAGFDMVYALLDEEFDRRAGLYSVPARLGAGTARRLAMGLHGAAWLAFAAFGWAAGLGMPYALGCGIAGGLLVWEHRLAARGDAASVNRAFFQVNAAVGLLLLMGVWFAL
jgi:4-hydroxybenzoate polyprenyltransferase